MAQYISLVESNQELSKQVGEKVKAFNSFTDGDKLAIELVINKKNLKARNSHGNDG